MPFDDDAIARLDRLLESGDLQGARDALRELGEELRARDLERKRALSEMRHDVGNSLAIAQASIEGMLDGVVAISDRRLNRVRDILAGVSASMYRLTSDDHGDASPR